MANQPIYPIGGFPKDSFGFPHYEKIQQTNIVWGKSYLQELKKRAENRTKLRGQPHQKNWNIQLKKAHINLAKLFNLTLQKKLRLLPKPKIDFKTEAQIRKQTILWEEYFFQGKEEEISFTKITSYKQTTEKKVVFYIPSTGLGHLKIQPASEILKEISVDLEDTILIIPQFKSISDFSATQNKGLLIQGYSQIGIMVSEILETMNAYLMHYHKERTAVFLAGSTTGGLVALLAGALCYNLSGVIVFKPERIGAYPTPEALMVPYFNKTTDMAEILALNQQHKTLLIQAKGWPCLKYTNLQTAKGNLNNLLEPFLKNNKSNNHWSPSLFVPIKLKHRTLNISNLTNKTLWGKQKEQIKKTFKKLCNISKKTKPLKVTQVGQSQLTDCLRTEYHILTSSNTLVNLAFYQPFPLKTRGTVLCLPGSSSDVAKLESQYVHEVIAKGWNAVSIDARVRLYDFHPNIPEHSSIIAQSLNDLLVCCDWVFKNNWIHPKKVAVTGVSQGGTHSWMLAALEERICASVPICGLCSYESIIREQVNDYYNGNGRSFLDSHSIYYFIPYILNFMEQQDICALLAPRAFKPINADHDDCFPLSGIQQAEKDLKHLYKVLGVSSQLEFTMFKGGHSMPENVRKMAYDFIEKVFAKVK